jgi:GDPmannose 4,6-dehydratase
MKKALITGVSGQDGSYLADLLFSRGYEVHGTIRRHSIAENQDTRILNKNIKTYYCDISDHLSLFELIKKIKPDEIYNLAAMSHVRISFDIPVYTLQTNGLAVLSILDFAKNYCPDVKLYQASSSEMYGNSVDSDGYQRLTTPMNPTSPYGCAKVLAYNLVRHYRSAYGLFFCNGILFNHESPRRGSNFVTNKVIKTAVEIKLGISKRLELGNLDSSRDWGHSKDYVRAMNLILQYPQPKDWIIATGDSRTVRELCDITFKILKLNYKDFVHINKNYLRPEELNFLRGDSSESRNLLKWKPEYTFENMISEMIAYWIDFYKKK